MKFEIGRQLNTLVLILSQMQLAGTMLHQKRQNFPGYY
jgi:hypothetical protein